MVFAKQRGSTGFTQASLVGMLVAFSFFIFSFGQAEEPLPLRIEPFRLPDQFQREHSVTFTNGPVRLLTVADQKGAEQLPPWIDAVKQRFGTNLPMIAVADVSSVPRLLRGMVRKKFVERYSYPVLLDFRGEVVRLWPTKADQPNLYLVSPDGRVLASFHQTLSPESASALIQAATTNGVPAVMDTHR